MYKQRGLSIVELMIAMSLSLLLAIGIYQVFTSNQQSARLTQALVQVQDTGRLTLDLMSRDIRNADYWGCAGDVSRVSSTVDDSDPAVYDADLHGFGLAGQVGIEASDDVGAGVDIDGVGVREGTDILEIRSMTSQGVSIAQAMPSAAAVLFVNQNLGFAQGDILAVSDCESADVFQVSNFNAAGGGTPGFNIVHNSGAGPVPGNTSGSLSKQYPAGSQILFPVYRSYFINQDGDDSRLMVKDETGTISVLSGGVEDMQLIFGLDSSGDGVANQFVNAATILADAALDFQQVLSVEVRLVIASSQVNVVDAGIEYSWNGDAALDAGVDLGRLRREFTAIATIRSRLP